MASGQESEQTKFLRLIREHFKKQPEDRRRIEARTHREKIKAQANEILRRCP